MGVELSQKLDRVYLTCSSDKLPASGSSGKLSLLRCK